jgi:hypothetical protein
MWINGEAHCTYTRGRIEQIISLFLIHKPQEQRGRRGTERMVVEHGVKLCGNRRTG